MAIHCNPINRYFHYCYQIFSSTMRRPCLFSTPEFLINVIFGKDRSALLLTGAKVNPKRVIDLNFKYCFPEAADACKDVLKNVE